MKRVEVAIAGRSYAVSIAQGALDQTGSYLEPFSRDRRLFVVADEEVWKLHGQRIAASGFDIALSTVRAGEAGKSWNQLIPLLDRLLELGVERGDHIVALGGGVTGDLAGFAAAILKRGCGYVQIPTTLLAQVDSSVGGKTGINVAAGKNLVGAFHQPAAVLIDPGVLNTLPKRELRAGYAEVVKYGLIADAKFFAWCEANGAALLAGEAEARLHAIESSVRAKAAIVAEDERERSGRRALLNLGHTFGHALEAETGFSERLLHGEAVALGITLAFRFSAERGLCPNEDVERVTTHFASVGLPVQLDFGTGRSLVAHMSHDKKRSGGRLPFILATGIGQAYVERSVELEEVERFLDGERV